MNHLPVEHSETYSTWLGSIALPLHDMLLPTYTEACPRPYFLSQEDAKKKGNVLSIHGGGPTGDQNTFHVISLCQALGNTFPSSLHLS